VDLFGEEESASQKKEEEATTLWAEGTEKEEAPSEQDLQKQLFNQLQDHLRKIGITVHNKMEMDAFLKEHGYDNIQEFI